MRRKPTSQNNKITETAGGAVLQAEANRGIAVLTAGPLASDMNIAESDFTKDISTSGSTCSMLCQRMNPILSVCERKGGIASLSVDVLATSTK